MNYSKSIFGKKLKEKILEKESKSNIGNWAYSVYYNQMHEISEEFKDYLLALSAMEDGPEFYLTYEELEQVADDLIQSKETTLESSFGKELKEKILKKESRDNIGNWVYSICFEHMGEISDEFEDLLLTLSTMEDGPEFYFPYEELEKICDDLIEHKKISI